MTTEELLKERYKVISGYPGCKFKVGDILTYVREIAQTYDLWRNEATGVEITYSGFHAYPHLFEPLPWWKERNVEDMPEYVKIISIPMLVERYVAIGQIVKVHKHFSTSWGDYNKSGCQVYGDDFMSYDRCVPATEADYNAYLQTTNQNKNNDTLR